MRNNLFIFLLLNVFLIANTPTNADFKNAILVNGNGVGSNLQSEISIVIDVNISNIAQFNHPTSSSSLTIAKGNIHNDLLLNKITYDSMHPKIAKILSGKLMLVFNLSDKNETSDKGNVVIKTNVLRDGKLGGATNSGELTIASIIDKAIPILLSAETIDSDTNGHIDNVKLIFTEDVFTNTTINNGFSVSSYTVLGISSSQGIGEDNNSPGSVNLYLRLQEKTFFDTNAQPSLSYSERLSNTLGDRDNNITTISSFSIKDKTKPILVSVSAKSVHNGADTVNVGFSEPILKPLKIGLTGEDISTGNGPSIIGASIKYFNDDRNITIELNETTPDDRNDHVGYINGRTVKVYMQGNAQDRHKNKFESGTEKTTSQIELEKIKPKLLSIAKLGDKKDFILSFNEAMANFNPRDDAHILYGGTSSSTGGNVAIVQATRSKNKKTFIIKVDNLPVFTEAEKRVITFVMEDEVKDLVGNSIDINDSNISYEITKDTTPPNAKSFIVNMNTKQITIDFNESVALSTFNPTAILISRNNESNISLTKHSKATYVSNVSDNSGKIIITLNDDINSLKSFLKDKEDFNISIYSNSGIIDFAGNVANSMNIPLLSSSDSFIADNISPKLLNWDYDLDNQKMILAFDEPMKVVDYNANEINISDSNVTFNNELTFNQNKSSAKAIPNNSIEITIFSSQVINILNTNLVAKDINHTFLEISANSGFQDIKGNSLKALTNSNALRAKIYKVNKNNISKLNLIPNTWNHVTIDKPTKLIDVMASGKISHIYSYKNEVWNASPTNIDPKIGYWIKASDSSFTLEVPSSSKAYIKGSKEDDLARIKLQTSGVFYLIGIENDLTYEEMHNFKNSICKNMRIHHYDTSNNLNLSGWDKNSSVLANSSLWVLCIK
jgi:hypothetical protein